MDVDPKYKVPAREEIAANWRGLWMVVRSARFYIAIVLGITAILGITPAIIVASLGRVLTALPRAIADGASSPSSQTVERALILLGGVCPPGSWTAAQEALNGSSTSSPVWTL